MTEFTCGIINDVHYGFPQEKEPSWIDSSLEQLVKAYNAADVDFVLNLGDTIEHKSVKQDKKHLKKLQRIFEKLDAPFYAIPGNHDVINIDPDSYVDLLGSINDKPYFSFDREDIRFIGLNTTHQDPDLHPIAGRLGEKQRAWLDAQLDTEKTVYIASHHLLHYRELEGNFYFDDKPELGIAVDKRSVTKLFQKHDCVEGVVSAHIHEDGRTVFHGVPHITCGAMDKTKSVETYTPSQRLLHGDEEESSLEKRP